MNWVRWLETWNQGFHLQMLCLTSLHCCAWFGGLSHLKQALLKSYMILSRLWKTSKPSSSHPEVRNKMATKREGWVWPEQFGHHLTAPARPGTITINPTSSTRQDWIPSPEAREVPPISHSQNHPECVHFHNVPTLCKCLTLRGRYQGSDTYSLTYFRNKSLKNT